MALVALVSLSGCTHLLGTGFVTSPDYIELMDEAARADAARLTALRDEAQARYRTNATPENRLRLALVLSAPTAKPEDALRGKELLSTLAESESAGRSSIRRLARAKLEDVEARLALLASHQEQSNRLSSLKRQLDEANAKIEELLNIEQSMENGRRRDGGEGFAQ